MVNPLVLPVKLGVPLTVAVAVMVGEPALVSA
jgi:hypothetical protein